MADTLSPLRQALADRYVVERELGRGGMATVFLAEDRKHGRKVALKVLDPALAALVGSERFLREIETAARLTHPHILPLHDSGAAGGFLYYVMPFVEGETLRARLDREGRLPVDTAVRLAREVAGALDYAHRQGVIHRDIKPENILLGDGHAVVADFGIARALGAVGGTGITQAGIAIGTPLYMSPEQASGDPAVDARSDVYALGCVLYEMLAGRPPFTGESAANLVWQQMTQPPPPLGSARPDAPPAVVAAVERALQKERGKRQESAAAFAAALGGGPAPAPRRAWRVPVLVLALASAAVLGGWALWRAGVWPAAGPRISALAVLPLEDLGPEAGREYFADGMTEALIANLAQIGALKVISRTSVMRYKGARKPLPEIARELGVDAVLEGTVLRSGPKVRITAQLIDAATDRHLWARTYERDLADVLALQMDVARAVAEEIRVVLSPQEKRRLDQSRPVDPEAYEAYLRGRFHWNTRTAEGFDAAIREFQRAIEIDPGYARAHAGLADCYVLLVEWRRRPAPEGIALARAAAERALALDSTLAEGYTSLAEARVIAWDWEGAEQAFRTALALNPGYATAHQWYGFFLSKMGRHDEAIAELRRALELDPLSLIIRTELARVYYHARRYDDALAMVEGVRALDSTFTDVSWMLGSIYVELPGRAAQAAARFRASEFDARLDLARALILAGRPAEGRAVLDSLLAAYARGDPNPRYAQAAEVYAALGQPDRAFEMLERAYARGVDEHLTYLKVRPPFDPLRADPRFGELLRRMRFPE